MLHTSKTLCMQMSSNKDVHYPGLLKPMNATRITHWSIPSSIENSHLSSFKIICQWFSNVLQREPFFRMVSGCTRSDGMAGCDLIKHEVL